MVVNFFGGVGGVGGVGAGGAGDGVREPASSRLVEWGWLGLEVPGFELPVRSFPEERLKRLLLGSEF